MSARVLTATQRESNMQANPTETMAHRRASLPLPTGRIDHPYREPLVSPSGLPVLLDRAGRLPASDNGFRRDPAESPALRYARQTRNATVFLASLAIVAIVAGLVAGFAIGFA